MRRPTLPYVANGWLCRMRRVLNSHHLLYVHDLKPPSVFDSVPLRTEVARSLRVRGHTETENKERFPNDVREKLKMQAGHKQRRLSRFVSKILAEAAKTSVVHGVPYACFSICSSHAYRGSFSALKLSIILPGILRGSKSNLGR